MPFSILLINVPSPFFNSANIAILKSAKYIHFLFPTLLCIFFLSQLCKQFLLRKFYFSQLCPVSGVTTWSWNTCRRSQAEDSALPPGDHDDDDDR